MCVCVSERACVRECACVRACVRACVCVRKSVRVILKVNLRLGSQMVLLNSTFSSTAAKVYNSYWICGVAQACLSVSL